MDNFSNKLRYPCRHSFLKILFKTLQQSRHCVVFVYLGSTVRGSQTIPPVPFNGQDIIHPTHANVAIVSGRSVRVKTSELLIELPRQLLPKRHLCVNFFGRLGNDIYQYASLVGIAQQNGMIPVIPRQSSLLSVFNLNVTTVSPAICNSFPRQKEKRACAFDEQSITLSETRSNYTLRGSFQSWRYFENSTNDLKREFVFKDEIFSKAMENLSHLLSKSRKDLTSVNITIVGVHVRRGDFATEQNIRFGYMLATRNYFRNAMIWFRKKHSPVLFVVCSDDVEWSRANIAESDVVFSVGLKPEVDLATLALCNHTVMSTGTFGWWAAWLAGGTTIYYKHQYRENSELALFCNKSDYMYPAWIAME